MLLNKAHRQNPKHFLFDLLGFAILGPGNPVIQRKSHKQIGKSISTSHDLFFSKGSSLRDICIRNYFTFFDTSINKSVGNFVGFLRPVGWIQIINYSGIHWVFLHPLLGLIAKALPISCGKRQILVPLKFIENRVPHFMEVADPGIWVFGVIRNGDCVAAEISLGVVMVDSGSAVEGLMNIAHIMDQESHGGRKTALFHRAVVAVLHDLLVGVLVLVIGGLSEPFGDSTDRLRNVVRIKREIVIGDFSSLVEVRNVDKVPALLVFASFVFDIIGKSGAFDHWVVPFFLCP